MTVTHNETALSGLSGKALCCDVSKKFYIYG